MARVHGVSLTVLQPGTVESSLPKVLVERKVAVNEMLRRIYWDATHRRLLYRDPDTGRIAEIRGIPDIALTMVRPTQHHDLRAMAGLILEMTDEQIQRQFDSAPKIMLRDVRRLAAHVVKVEADKTAGRSGRARVRTVGYKLKEKGVVVDERTS